MGAWFESKSFKNQTWKELKIAYFFFVEQQAWERGHGGYTGSFAEKPELYEIKGEWDADNAYEHCIKNNNKWGPAYAYHLADGTWWIGGWCSS